MLLPNGRELEYIEPEHLYVVDGIIVPSVTQVLHPRFGGKYAGIPAATLNQAAERGTAIHKSIETYYTQGIDDGREELRNVRWLSDKYGFVVVDNEVPVVIEKDGEPVAAGRLDLVLEQDGLGLADIKTTSSLDKEYLGYQLNLYRVGYEQTYGKKIDFLAGIWLRGEKRRYIEIPISDRVAEEML